MLALADTPMFAAEEAKKALIGLARDLRGLAFAFNTKASYMMLFDWMYPLQQFTAYLFRLDCMFKPHVCKVDLKTGQGS